ncbi:septum site-determining protein MinC [Psychrobacter sp. I-STPA10]|uniref:septum site-determining protein MinC n=1 Tax=Psychrobacter sp. I-STPA10 TaxID=2585769 RepID=UPI001E4BAD3A|nr:septum site-determining protein MinC [Psychrobacter sp. I-STPA10]
MTADHSNTNSALTLYGKMLTFSRIKLITDDLNAIDTALAELLSNKTSQIPIVIDSDIPQDLSAVVDLLWSWGLQPIGVIQGVLDQQAKQMRLAVFPTDGKRIERIRPIKKTESTTVAKNNQPSEASDAKQQEVSLVSDEMTTLIYDQMLRSGQSINHVGGDLILTNCVNNGAEVITDNSLHIYGRAQGRLVAGATGDKNARIFCQRFNPSLVSVAGTYCLADNIPENVIDKAVQVSFKEGEGLIFTVMNNS